MENLSWEISDGFDQIMSIPAYSNYIFSTILKMVERHADLKR